MITINPLSLPSPLQLTFSKSERTVHLSRIPRHPPPPPPPSAAKAFIHDPQPESSLQVGAYTSQESLRHAISPRHRSS
ncbi:hypothetical protein IE53DRAFT_383646 [Violaceomyces palustris]|uniref:Uncharacterized protein n=1 Tax=Violaceomyces palustris TaxID=1673888 RepID=A0ACD0P6X4_9BASI|nr:hypothetical protein IE53DRAFT_383646 [Violaceomyces palustris]